MEYSEILSSAFDYADRTDAGTTSRGDTFLRIVEARVNRELRTREMTTTTQYTTVAGQIEYSLPVDFNGLRDIRLYTNGTSNDPKSLIFYAPEYYNKYVLADGLNPCYTIVGSKIYLWPAQTDTILELAYYKKLVPLDGTTTSNWLSEQAPDVYIFGLMVEISSFVKDAEAALLWEQRFTDAVKACIGSSEHSTWTGPTPYVTILA